MIMMGPAYSKSQSRVIPLKRYDRGMVSVIHPQSQNASLPFLVRFQFSLLYMIELTDSKLLHKIVKFIKYANLCKFVQNF